jgi:hypothetical protein
MEVSGQLHSPAALPRGNICRHPFDRGWVGTRVGLDAVTKREYPIIVPVPVALITILTELPLLLLGYGQRF